MDLPLLLLALLAWGAGAAFFALTAYSAALFAVGARTPRGGAGTAADPARVTILVASLGRSKALDETLSRAEAVDHPDLEVILALGSREEGAPGPRPATMGTRLTLVSDHPQGKARTLNGAVSQASGDFLLLLDEDSSVDPGCLREMLPFARDPSVWAVVGEPYPSNARTAVERTLALEAEAWTAAARAKDRLGLFLPATGFFSLVRKGSLPSGGGPWDEGALAEDTDLSLRQEARGLRTRLSAARVGIEAPSSIGALTRQRLRWYKGMYDALWKNRGLVIRLPFPKSLDAAMTLLAPLAPAALVVLLLLSPLWPLALGPVLLGVLSFALLSAWVSSSKLRGGRLGVVLFSVPYAVVQGLVSLAALGAFLLHVRVKWQRTPKSGDEPR